MGPTALFGTIHGLTVLLQLIFIFIYSTFSNNFLVSAKYTFMKIREVRTASTYKCLCYRGPIILFFQLVRNFKTPIKHFGEWSIHKVIQKQPQNFKEWFLVFFLLVSTKLVCFYGPQNKKGKLILLILITNSCVECGLVDYELIIRDNWTWPV